MRGLGLNERSSLMDYGLGDCLYKKLFSLKNEAALDLALWGLK